VNRNRWTRRVVRAGFGVGPRGQTPGLPTNTGPPTKPFHPKDIYFSECVSPVSDCLASTFTNRPTHKNRLQQQSFNGLCSATTLVGRYQKKHSAFCLSIELCCVQAGFPHLLSSGFLWSRGRLWRQRYRQSW